MANSDNEMLYESEMTYADWEQLINNYIFDQMDRDILKKHLLDNVSFEKLAEEFNRTNPTIQARYKKAKKKLFQKVRKENKGHTDKPGTWI